jgi:hypothetical protein
MATLSRSVDQEIGRALSIGPGRPRFHPYGSGCRVSRQCLFYLAVRSSSLEADIICCDRFLLQVAVGEDPTTPGIRARIDRVSTGSAAQGKFRLRSACMPRECRSKNHSLNSTFIYIHLLCPNSWDLHGSPCGFIDQIGIHRQLRRTESNACRP